jgi:hypothetical protein
MHFFNAHRRFATGRIQATLATLVIILSVILPTIASAQCIPDCPDSAWKQPRYDTVNASRCSDSCLIEVKWTYRNACGSCDVWFYEFRRVGGTCSCSDSAFINAAVAAFLLQKTPGCAQTAYPCYNVWRVVMGGCWRKVLQWPGPDYHYYPCEGTECCLSTYQICLDSLGRRTVTQTSPPGTNVDCSLLGDECFQACGYLPGGIITEKRVHAPLRELRRSWVEPNPAGGTATVFLTGAADGTLAIDLIDMRGIAVAHLQFSRVRSSGAEFVVDLSTLSTGRYRYRIMSDGEIVSEGSIAVER